MLLLTFMQVKNPQKAFKTFRFLLVSPPKLAIKRGVLPCFQLPYSESFAFPCCCSQFRQLHIKKGKIYLINIAFSKFYNKQCSTQVLTLQNTTFLFNKNTKKLYNFFIDFLAVCNKVYKLFSKLKGSCYSKQCENYYFRVKTTS